MRPSKAYCFTLIFLVLGCKIVIKPVHEYSPSPNRMKGLNQAFNNVDISTFDFDGHQITIGGLYISKKSISVKEYLAFIQDLSRTIRNDKLEDSLLYYFDIKNSPIKLIASSLKTDPSSKNSAMTYVTYYGAYRYCEWLTNKYCTEEEIPRFRLPSEYEWIAALRQGKIGYDKKINIGNWVEESSCVKTYRPLIRKECIVDWFSPYPSPSPDSSIVKYVIKSKVAVDSSAGHHKDKIDAFIGFRVAQTKLNISESHQF